MRLPRNWSTFESMTLTVAAGAMAALAAIVVAAAALTMAPPRAAERCHVSPGGGGKLTSTGQKYKR